LQGNETNESNATLTETHCRLPQSGKLFATCLKLFSIPHFAMTPAMVYAGWDVVASTSADAAL